MIQVDRMMGIILALMFAVVLASFAFSMVSEAEKSATGKIQINNTQAMTQLVMYDSLIAYTCSQEKGGFYEGTQTVGGDIYWASWEKYKDENDFGKLEAANGGPLECHGSTSKLPLAQGIDLSPGKDTWLNDQQGKYSRKDFVITETENDDPVKLGPCIIHETSTSDGDMDATYFFTQPDISAVTTYNNAFDGQYHGPGYNFNFPDDDISEGECERIDGTTSSDHANKGPVITTVVINADEIEESSQVEGWDNEILGGDTGIDAGGTQGDSDFNINEYKLCEGTSGYIQTNVGRNDVEKSRSESYSADNPPGSSDDEVGGDPKANTIHPFIVFTNWNNDCY